MGAKIGPKSEKCWKNGVRKMMLKKGAKKMRYNGISGSTLGRPGVVFGAGGGRGGTVKPDLIQISFKNGLHRWVCRMPFGPKWPPGRPKVDC
jgi:hypothetical protein